LGLKFSLLTPITLRVVVITSRNFTSPGDNVENILEGVHPTKFRRAKNV